MSLESLRVMRRPYDIYRFYCEEYKKQKPQRDMARRAVHALVLKGQKPKIRTLSCVDCGKRADRYDHWKGYEKEFWTDVQPVCIDCDSIRNSKRVEELWRLIKENIEYLWEKFGPQIEAQKEERLAKIVERLSLHKRMENANKEDVWSMVRIRHSAWLRLNHIAKAEGISMGDVIIKALDTFSQSS